MCSWKRQKRRRVLLSAPTGRAAKRLAELTGLEAKTIHRLLGLRVGGEAQANEENPLDADLVFDVRFLPNPHYDELLRPLPGESPQIRAFVLGAPATGDFMRHLTDMMDYLLPQYVEEGKAHLTVALGCTGGKHRSVVLADELAAYLSRAGYRITVRHRDVGKE